MSDPYQPNQPGDDGQAAPAWGHNEPPQGQPSQPQPYPGQAAPQQPYPGQPYPGQVFQGQPYQGQAYSPPTYPGQPYGGGPNWGPGYDAPVPTGPLPRPGVVTAAAVITIVFSSLGVLLSLLAVAIGALINSDSVRDELSTADYNEIRDYGTAIVIVSLLLIALGIAGIVFGAMSLGRRNGARIGAIVCASITIVLTAPFGLFGGIYMWVATIAAIVAIVFFLQKPANAFYASGKA